MNRSKDQILLENIYSNIAQQSIENQGAISASEDKGDYDRAEKILSDALERNGVFVDPTSEVYREALDELVAAIQHSPEDEQETANKLALSLDQPEQSESEENLDMNEISDVPEQHYESKTILNAYKKVIAEASKKKAKNNEYAICTAAVGRENEAKYKRCKEKVKRSK